MRRLFWMTAAATVALSLAACSDDSSSPGAAAGAGNSPAQGGSSGANAGGQPAAGTSTGGTNAGGQPAAGQGAGGEGTAGQGMAGQGAGGAGTAGQGAGGFDPGGQVTKFSSGIGPIPVESGGEDTRCIVKRLNNAEAAYVRRFHTTLEKGSHHLILYRSKATEEQLEPKPCQGFSGIFQGDHAVFIAQQKESELLMPNTEDGTPVALQIEANQMVRIEMHYFNTSDAAYEVTGDVEIETIPLSSKVVKADLAFWGTTSINIPPHSEKSTPINFQKALENTRTFALTTHQHHYGTRMKVWYGTGANDQGQVVADETNWSDPALELFAPPLEFPKGEGKGFAYQCTWNNTSDTKVGFGESVNDEMCFLWHYYYPSKGFQICIEGQCF